MALQPSDIHEVLIPAGGALVLDQLRTSDHGDNLVAKSCLEASAPSVLVGHAINICEQVDADRFNTDLEDHTWFREVVWGQVVQRSSKPSERLENPHCVWRGWPYPEIEVLRRTYQPVRCERMGANDEELNAGGVELG